MMSAHENGHAGNGAHEPALPDLTGDEVRALADLGFIALSRGLDTHAAAIFDGLSIARPEQEVGAIGRALVKMLRGDVDEAIALLRTLGPSDAVQAFLGMALARQGLGEEAQHVLNDVVRHAPASPVADFARDILAAKRPAS